jgi:hypothetical protein
MKFLTNLARFSPDMKFMLNLRHVLLLGAVSLISALPSPAKEAIVVEIGADPAGPMIPADALGLSYETSILRPNADGLRYFRPGNRELLQVFKTIGVKSLRIGGNSVDDPKVPLPDKDDVRSLFRFARKAGTKIIYSVRLQDGDPASAAEFAQLIHEEFRNELDCFAIGNEPGYYKDYAVYKAKWVAIRDAIVRVFPEARFCGADDNPKPALIANLVRDFGTGEGRLVQITQHSYPFGCSYKNPRDGMKDVKLLIPVDATEARNRMVTSPPHQTYEEILKGMTAAVAGTPLTFRLTETNSYWFSGLEGASDRHASALWALDYLHWWMSHGAAGINFHTGDRTGGSVNLPCRYAAFVTSAQGYEVRPLAYGMKLFAESGAGRYLPARVEAAPGNQVAAYAVARGDGVIAVTLINRDTKNEAGIRVDLPSAKTVKGARVLKLQARANDIAAESRDVTLNDAAIDEGGEWKGKWTVLGQPAIAGTAVSVTLAPASAAVVEVSTVPQR